MILGDPSLSSAWVPYDVNGKPTMPCCSSDGSSIGEAKLWCGSVLPVLIGWHQAKWQIRKCIRKKRNKLQAHFSLGSLGSNRTFPIYLYNEMSCT